MHFKLLCNYNERVLHAIGQNTLVACSMLVSRNVTSKYYEIAINRLQISFNMSVCFGPRMNAYLKSFLKLDHNFMLGVLHLYIMFTVL